MQQIWAMAGKDLKLLIRDKVGFFFTFGFPILYASLFGIIMSGFSGGDDGESMRLSVAVVDEDNSAASRDFLQRLKSTSELVVTTATREQATNLVRKGHRAAFVVIPAGYGESARRFFWSDPPRLTTGVDPSQKAQAGMLQGILTRELFAGVQSKMTDGSMLDDSMAEVSASEDIDPVTRGALLTFLPALKNMMASMPAGESAVGGFQPAEFETVEVAETKDDGGVRNMHEISFPQGIIWGIMSCAAAFGIAMVTERTQGTLARLTIAPIERWHVLAGKAVACFLTTAGVAAALLVFAIVVFKVRPTSYAKLGISIVMVSSCFVGVMMLLSILGRTEQSAGGIGWSILMVMAMFGGGMIPLAFLPGWIQDVASFSPVKWSILALEGAMWRNFSLSELMVPWLVLLGIGLATFVLGARLFRWSTGTA